MFISSLEEPAINRTTRRSKRYPRAKSTSGTSYEMEATNGTRELVGATISGLCALQASRAHDPHRPVLPVYDRPPRAGRVAGLTSAYLGPPLQGRPAPPRPGPIGPRPVARHDYILAMRAVSRLEVTVREAM